MFYYLITKIVLVVFTLGGHLSLFLRERGCNRPFYSCLFSDLAFEWQQCWR